MLSKYLFPLVCVFPALILTQLCNSSNNHSQYARNPTGRSCACPRINVFPRLLPNKCFPVLAAEKMFSRVCHRLHVSRAFLPVSCFPALFSRLHVFPRFFLGCMLPLSLAAAFFPVVAAGHMFPHTLIGFVIILVLIFMGLNGI